MWRGRILFKIPREDSVHGDSLYVAIWFSEASWEIAPESKLLYHTTSFIHSMSEILAPNEPSANRRSPPLFRWSMFLTGFLFQRGYSPWPYLRCHDILWTAEVIDNPFISAYGNIFYTLQYTKFIVNLVVQSPWTLNTTSMTSVATQSVLGCNNVLWALKGTFPKFDCVSVRP